MPFSDNIVHRDTASDGGNGGMSYAWGHNTTEPAGGVVAGASPSRGAALVNGVPGPGAGGGAASTAGGGPGGRDRDGLRRRGGGGGASVNGNNSGAGGNGGPAYARIICIWP
jgi:hypothetical protein